MPLGYAFSPTQAQADQAKAGQVSPPFGSQGAVKTLNFSLPKVTGAAGSSALSPLVGEQRRGPGISSAVLESVLRTVLGPDHAAMVLAPQPMPGGSTDTGETFSSRGAIGGGGQNDGGLAALLASLNGGGGQAPMQTPAPVIHPGDDDPNAPQSAGRNEFTGRSVVEEDPIFVDRTEQQGPPRTPNFGSDWRTQKYEGENF